MLETLDLMRLFKGFIRNYGTLLLGEDTTSTYTHREVGHWMKLGEMMGFFTRQEVNRTIRGRDRRVDLLWLTDDYETPILHLESENAMLGTELIKNRLDPTVPYLVALFWQRGEEDEDIYRAALKLRNRSKSVRQILLIIWKWAPDGKDLLVTGARFTRRKDYPDIAYARLRAIEQHKAKLYFGILEEDWNDVWSCDFCHATFLSRKEAEEHEATCPERTDL